MIAKQSIGKSFTGALNYNIKKLHHPDPRQRAEILSTNFTNMGSILKELAMMRAMNPRLKRNTYHASLNFALGEKISNQKMQIIADEYMKRMGFDNNLYIIFRHHDSKHPHCHILATRNKFDGTVVSDSNNYKRSEQIVRELEKKYHLQIVKSSKQSKLKAPNRNELEMIERTGRPSKKLMLQIQVKEALKQSATMSDFIKNLERQNINVLFNQASTGKVSGITYQIPGFKIRGQALGNQFKFGSIIKQVTYEQSRESQAISEANRRTRAKFGEAENSRTARDQAKHSGYDGRIADNGKKSVSGDQLSAGSSTDYFGNQETNHSHGKENESLAMDMDRSTDRSILVGLADLLAGNVNNESEKRKEKRKRGMAR